MQGKTVSARELLVEFATRTGLTGEGSPDRYLWTDAFAACTCLGLHASTGRPEWLRFARALADQVHRVLGRHRPDDTRTGWLSGLGTADGARHPTVAGLRIGKPLPERGPEERFDRALEWERDGQYYHYIARWIQTLCRLSAATGDATAARHAAELAAAAHRGFSYRTPGGEPRLHWKMSIDLQRPLVPSMGQHDPLDGLVATAAARAALRRVPEGLQEATAPRLDRQVRELVAMCQGRNWATDDPLGTGGLLVDALHLARLLAADEDGWGDERAPAVAVLESAVADAGRSVRTMAGAPLFRMAPDRRLAFRELGLSLGLAGVGDLRSAVGAAGAEAGRVGASLDAIETIEEREGLRASIHRVWTAPEHRATPLWLEHRDINDVMLAASLAPDGCLGIVSPTARHEAADG